MKADQRLQVCCIRWHVIQGLHGVYIKSARVLELGLLQEVKSLPRRFMEDGTQAGALSSSASSASWPLLRATTRNTHQQRLQTPALASCERAHASVLSGSACPVSSASPTASLPLT